MAPLSKLALAFLLSTTVLTSDIVCPEVKCMKKLATVQDTVCSSQSPNGLVIRPCGGTDEFCDERTGVCRVERAMTEYYPGEKCQEDSFCFGDCVGNVCTGWGETDYCDFQLTCHVGLRCMDHTCVPLLKAGESCSSDNDCENSLTCHRGTCIRLFSLPAGESVTCPGEVGKHFGCYSGLCADGVCLQMPEQHTATPEMCERDGECDTHFQGIVIPGVCQCTVSPYKSIKTCAPRITDLRYKERILLLQEWTHSSSIHLCHRHTSMSFACMRRVWDWDRTKRLMELTIEKVFKVSFHLLDTCLETHYWARARTEILYVDA